MEKQLYLCIALGVVFVVISILLWMIKKTALLVITAVIAFLLFTRGGLLYMAMDYAKGHIEPTVMEFKQDLEELDVPKPELKFTLPTIEYVEKDSVGFGQAEENGEYKYSTPFGEAVVDYIKENINN